MDEARNKQIFYNKNHPSNPFVLISWYELVDNCSNCGGWPLVENHFGILALVTVMGTEACLR
jgi:hypothetical protein